MITSRILFLSTYDSNLDFDALIKNHSLGDNVNYVREKPFDPLTVVHADLYQATGPTCKAIPQIRAKATHADG